jgi:hypothetical protein
MGFLSSLFGSGAYNKVIGDLEKDKAAETSYYQKVAYEDPLNNSANAAALKQARDLLMANNQRTAAAAAVTGATDESVAREKAAGVQAVADAASKIASTGTQRKDAAMQNYLQATRDYNQKINEARLQKEQAQTSALGGLLQSGLNIATTFIPAAGALKAASQVVKQ